MTRAVDWLGGGKRAALAALGAMLCWGAVVASTASGYVYFVGQYGQAIHRMKVDGSHVQSRFIPAAAASAIAVNSSHIYWFDTNTKAPVNDGTGLDSVAAANLDGSRITKNLIPIRAQVDSPGLAIDPSHVYFADPGPGFPYNTIARATLAGGDLQPLLVNDGPDWNRDGGPLYLAVAGRYLYWLDGNGNIGRSGLDGSQPNDRYISHLPKVSQPGGFAAAGSHLYWTSPRGIARIGLDGHGLDAHFVRTADAPRTIAVFGRHIYWGEGTFIRRADLNGSHVRTLHRSSSFDTVNAIAVDGRG